MRTTVTLDPDIAAAVQQLRQDRGFGLSAALNHLARSGLTVKQAPPPFRQKTAQIGLRVDVTNVAEALEVLDGSAGR